MNIKFNKNNLFNNYYNNNYNGFNKIELNWNKYNIIIKKISHICILNV